MKQCFKCKRKKSIDMFYTHPQMADGHLGKCKTCTQKDMRARYDDPEARERIRAYDRERSQRPERKAKVLEYLRRGRARHPGKDRARKRVANAIRDGRLERMPCEVCKSPNSQAHHHDYRSPLKVTWLCFQHHREAHNQTVAMA